MVCSVMAVGCQGESTYDSFTRNQVWGTANPGVNLQEKITIPKADPTEAIRTLGYFIAPSGNSYKQIENLLQKAEKFKQVMSDPSVSMVDAYILYKVFYPLSH